MFVRYTKRSQVLVRQARWAVNLTNDVSSSGTLGGQLDGRCVFQAPWAVNLTSDVSSSGTLGGQLDGRCVFFKHAVRST